VGRPRRCEPVDEDPRLARSATWSYEAILNSAVSVVSIISPTFLVGWPSGWLAAARPRWARRREDQGSGGGSDGVRRWALRDPQEGWGDRIVPVASNPAGATSCSNWAEVGATLHLANARRGIPGSICQAQSGTSSSQRWPSVPKDVRPRQQRLNSRLSRMGQRVLLGYRRSSMHRSTATSSIPWPSSLSIPTR
jgi:hypothetical protein